MSWDNNTNDRTGHWSQNELAVNSKNVVIYNISLIRELRTKY
jgi:hypothetical protein